MKQMLALIALPVMLVIFVVPDANAQWMKTSCPYASYVNCFAAVGTNLFAGTQLSGVYLSTDSGISWRPQSNGLPTGYCPIQCFAVSGTNLFAGLGNVSPNGVFRSTDSGNSWTTTNTVLTNNPVYAIAVSDTNLFASTGHVFISTDEGRDWTVVDSGLPTNEFVYSLAVNGNDLFAGTGNVDTSGVFVSINNGTNWSATSNDFRFAGVFAIEISGSNLFVGTGDPEVNEGGVFLSTNGGSSWSDAGNDFPTNSGPVSSLTMSGTNIFAGILGGGVYMLAINSKSWIAENSGLTDSNVFSLTSFGGFLFAGTDSGVFRRSLSDFNQSGVAENAHANSDDNLHIFPNPSTDELQILGGQAGTIHLFDIMGRERMSATMTGEGASPTTLDVSSLESGIYFLRVGNQSTKVEIAR
jgi:hypothetical protein